MGRIQQNVEAADSLLAAHGQRAPQHVVDLIQAAIRGNATDEELENLDMILRMIMAAERQRSIRADQPSGPDLIRR